LIWQPVECALCEEIASSIEAFELINADNDAAADANLFLNCDWGKRTHSSKFRKKE